MEVLLLALMSFAMPHYSHAEIEALPETGALGEMVLTERGLVAGYWYRHVAPGHAGAVLAKPFVWTGDQTIALPTGEGKYGHVRAGNDAMLVGDVESEDRSEWLPALWKPHPQEGWKRAQLEMPKVGPGQVEAVSSDGTPWIRKRGSIVRWKGNDETSIAILVDKFDVAGVADSGEVFGTRYSDVGFAGSRGRQRAGFYKGSAWNELTPAETSYITAFSPTGDVGLQVYREGWKPVISRRGKLEDVVVDDSGEVGWISRGGAVAGYSQSQDRKMRATLWVDGKRIDITEAIAGLTLTQAKAVNDRGQVLAVSPREGRWAHSRLFLLTPRLQGPW